MYKSRNPLFWSAEPPESKQEVVSSAFVSDAQTGTIEWVLKPKARTETSPVLTIHDRRELAKTDLKDDVYFAKAKRVYAAGGGVKKIRSECGKSLSYARKVHRAFSNAEKGTGAKNGSYNQ